MTGKKRTLICTFLALGLGLFGGYLGGQISFKAQKEQCQTWIKFSQLESVCHLFAAPIAVDKAIAGWWTGTILGAFAGGLITRESQEDLTAD
ncbi:MAG TPA: hypothetical protein V6D28_00650 [Leptolyngbyaceae cyanobacterium]